MFKLPPDFVPFDPQGAFRNYVRNLPHWRQPGASYFLTFRLNDSLPASVVQEIRREKLLWEQRIARERALHSGTLPSEVADEFEMFQWKTARRLERVLDDGHGSCAMKNPTLREIVAEALLYFQGERYAMHGFVVMPNHVHLAVKPLREWEPEKLLQSWKRHTSRNINLHLGSNGQLWQYDTWNRIIRDAAHWGLRHALYSSESSKG